MPAYRMGAKLRQQGAERARNGVTRNYWLGFQTPSEGKMERQQSEKNAQKKTKIKQNMKKKLFKKKAT